MLSNYSLKSQSTIAFTLFFLLNFGYLISLSAESPHSERRIIIDKAKKKLVLLKDGKQITEYTAAFGIDPDSDKYKAHDGATPEGLYYITYKKSESRFHRFLGLSYPNLKNATNGLTRGVISFSEYERIYRAMKTSGRGPCDTGLGCGIGIHGGGVYRWFGKTKETNWTEGCIAIDDEDIEKVFEFCRSGDPVIIFNSSRNLCGIIRPFTHINALNKNGLPLCVEGVYTYQIEIPTSLGRMQLTLKEGKDFGKSITVVVSDNRVPENPLLVLTDNNADGHLYALDNISGPIAEGKAPDATYALVKEAVIRALSKGAILDSNPPR
jgi:hypothetical protein